MNQQPSKEIRIKALAEIRFSSSIYLFIKLTKWIGLKSHICNRCGTSFNSEDELRDHCRTMWH